MTDINTWNAVDDSNNVASPAGWPEGMMPSGVNNSARAMMGSIKRWRDQTQPTVNATGIGNAQVITYPVAPAALAAGDRFTFYSVNTNNAPATLQVNAQPAKAIRSAANVALVGGEMPIGTIVSVYYDGTNFRLAGDPVALKKSGDTMTGTLTVPGITYPGTAGHVFAFGWDGVHTHVYVDTNDVGTIGDIDSVTAGNGLAGGGSSGALTLSMSGSYTGNFTATGTVTAGGTVTANGYQTRAGVGGAATGNFFNMQWTGGAANLWIDNVNQGPLALNASLGNYLPLSGGTLSGQLTVNAAITCQIIKLNAVYDTLSQEALGISNDIVYMANTHTFNNKPNNQTFAYFNGGGCYNVNGGWGAFSDPALKENVEPYSRGLEAVRQLNPVTFRYRAGTPFASAQTDAPLLGLMADQVAPHVPEIVGETVIEVDGAERTMATLTPGNLVYALINAVKELSARVEQLETALVK